MTQTITPPDGFMLVPIEPTDAMADAGEYSNSEWLNDAAPIGQKRYRQPAIGVYRAMLAAAPQPQQDDEQSVFEEWLASKCPSGDVEAVERQWEASSEYADFHNPPTPADAQTARDAALEEAAKICERYGTAIDNGCIAYIRSRDCMRAAEVIRALKHTASAPAADDLTLRQLYEDACIAANANAHTAAKWRSAVVQWRIKRVEVFPGVHLTNTKGISWGDLERQIVAAMQADAGKGVMADYREPYKRVPDARDIDRMNLPDGKTCGDCARIRRCHAMFGRIEGDERCDWAPSRFVQRVVADAMRGE